jgi:hypothetical protein
LGTVLTRVVGLGPVPGWLGLEPPPERDPVVRPLGFSWNQLSDAEFSAQMQVLEQQLQSGYEVGKRPLGGGGNGSYLVELDTGPTVVWKPRARQKKEVSRQQVGRVDEGKREAAAYQVDRFLGHLARVPCAVAGLKGREGTLCVYVTEGIMARDLGDKQVALDRLRPEDLRRLALFDHIIGNLDRHGGNWLLDCAGRPIPIDHGLSFPKHNGEQGMHHFDFAADLTLNPQETDLLRGFLGQRQAIEKTLAPLLEPEAIEAMFERVEVMLVGGRTDNGWRQDTSPRRLDLWGLS